MIKGCGIEWMGKRGRFPARTGSYLFTGMRIFNNGPFKTSRMPGIVFSGKSISTEFR
jgi:hypothetical protein